MSVGYHCIWDVYDCDESKISFIKEVQLTLNELVKETQLTAVNESYKQFSPVGVTGVILLEESHISIHTWPEKKFAAIDVFSCKRFDDSKMENMILKLLGASKIKTNMIKRGV